MLQLPNYIRKVINTLPNIKRRDVLTFFVCLAISAIFWVVQSAYNLADTTVNVNFRIDGMPDGAVFTTHVPSELRVTLYDSNLQLFRYGGRSKFRSLNVDFDRYADVAGNFRISGAELQSLLMNELPSTTQITAISPALIDARFALTDGKRVPVTFNADLRTRGNFKDFAPIISPDSVLIHAPSIILDTLSHISTAYYYASDIHDTLRLTLPLELNVGVKATPDSVKITVPVTQYVEKTFETIPISVEGLPSGMQLVLFPHNVRMTCLANFGHYNSFTADDFTFSVSYEDIRKDKNRQFLPITFHTLLSDKEVYGITFSPTEVEFTLEEH